MGAVDTARLGRPRDDRIDTAVLEATLELLAEIGYARTTIQAVARRARVSAPAIYRRWANRVELIESAIFPTLQGRRVAWSGDLATDVGRYVALFTSTFGSPAARAAVPALLSEYQSAPDEHRSVALRLGMGVREEFRELLAAQPPDSIADDIDPDHVLDALIGSVLYRTFVLPFTGRPVRGEPTTDVVMRLLRPAVVRTAPDRKAAKR